MGYFQKVPFQEHFLRCKAFINVRSFILLSLICISFILVSCGKAPEQMPSAMPAVDTETSSGEPLRIVMGGTRSSWAVFDMINKILSDNGMKLVVEQSPSTITNEAGYTTYVKQEILNGANDRVFLVPGGLKTDIVLQDEGILGNFYQDALIYAPKYMERKPDLYYNTPSTLFRIPTNFRKVSPQTPVVLVREDVAQEYGGDITTGSEYIDLLQWLKEQNPDSVPGTALADIWGTTAYMPLDLILPEYGYSNIGQTMNYLEIDTGRVFPTWSLPESRFAIEEYTRLRRDGLLHLVSAATRKGGALNNYATILLYDYDLIENISLYSFSGFSDFNVSDYLTFPLYNQQIPIPTISGSNSFWSPTMAITGAETDISEFMRFLEWLEEPEHYWRLFYGEEGVDYNLIDGRIEFLQSNPNWEMVRAILIHFERSEFKLIPSTAPQDYGSALANIESAYELIFTDETYEILDDWENRLSEVEKDELSSYWNDMDEMNKSLFVNMVPDKQTTSDIIDQFIEKQRSREPLLLDHAHITQTAINNNRDLP